MMRSDRVISNELEWQPSGAEGFWIKPLREDHERGERTLLMKVDPGAWVASHAHEDEFEECFVVEGSFYDEHGTLNAGDYCSREPGEPHTAGSRDGALILLIYSKRAG